jgi:hypothetical protein
MSKRVTKKATAAQKKGWLAIERGRKMDCPSHAPGVGLGFVCTRDVGHAQPHVGHGADPEAAGFAAWDDAGWYEERGL